ncbi:MAG: sensor histidine kinase [Acidobacteria bacterium]|nr:sensor histidine kinase [Acidobacteriota bacterium]
MRSLRARILWGAALWTIGLCIGTLLVATAVMIQYRQVAVVLHGAADSHAFLGIGLVLAFLFAGFVQMRKGLSSFRDLRGRLARVHAGQDARVQGRYASEVQPLVDDLNALLEHRDQVVRRALAKAGDLAHGLKTPLAVLTHEADRVRTAGQRDLADALLVQVQGMQRQIDYHLAQARAAASGATPGATASVRECAEALARTLQRLHATRGLTIHVDVDPAHAVRVQRQDLDEMLGNLLDNACKWTRGSVSIASSLTDKGVAITVDDDGAGVPLAQRERVLQRGVKADEAAPGSGLGLAIVRDLAELYRGSLSLEDSVGGGLRARLVLPSAAE